MSECTIYIDAIVFHCFVMENLPPKSELNLSYARSTPPLLTILPRLATLSVQTPLFLFILSFSLLPQACLLRYLFSLSGVDTHFPLVLRLPRRPLSL